MAPITVPLVAMKGTPAGQVKCPCGGQPPRSRLRLPTGGKLARSDPCSALESPWASRQISVELEAADRSRTRPAPRWLCRRSASGRAGSPCGSGAHCPSWLNAADCRPTHPRTLRDNGPTQQQPGGQGWNLSTQTQSTQPLSPGGSVHRRTLPRLPAGAVTVPIDQVGSRPTRSLSNE
jgi:hypothetical protein